MSEAITHYLARSLIKDVVKGGTGWRSVQEIASACGPEGVGSKVKWVAREIVRMEGKGEVQISHEPDGMFARATMEYGEARKECPLYIP